ncbi:MAG TPA: hypothetical protein VEV63_13125 [Streptosporangiaceae bacterium]|nr:hypothetical protein [Streptosporangiaceae bacterium]
MIASAARLRQGRCTISGDNGESGRLVFARTPAGEPVAECEVAPGDIGALTALADEAAAGGAALLWVHCSADLSEAGFARRHGYRRFAAQALPSGDRLPLLDTATALDLLSRAFLGRWGHHQLDDTAEAFLAQTRFVGLGEPGHWTGLCGFEAERRNIDGPGFIVGQRSPDAVRRLVLGAAGHLGPGPVTLETWGDPADEYIDLGFSVEEESTGWERSLLD